MKTSQTYRYKYLVFSWKAVSNRDLSHRGFTPPPSTGPPEVSTYTCNVNVVWYLLYRCWYDTYRLNVFWRLGWNRKLSWSWTRELCFWKPLQTWSVRTRQQSSCRVAGSHSTGEASLKEAKGRTTDTTDTTDTTQKLSRATTRRTFISTNLDVLYTIKLSACMKTCFLVSHITATITLYVLWHGSLKQPYYYHYTTHNVSCSMFSRV